MNSVKMEDVCEWLKASQLYKDRLELFNDDKLEYDIIIYPEGLYKENTDINLLKIANALDTGSRRHRDGEKHTGAKPRHESTPDVEHQVRRQKRHHVAGDEKDKGRDQNVPNGLSRQQESAKGDRQHISETIGGAALSDRHDAGVQRHADAGQ